MSRKRSSVGVFWYQVSVLGVVFMALIGTGAAPPMQAVVTAGQTSLFDLPRGFVDRGVLYCASENVLRGREASCQNVSIHRLSLPTRTGKKTLVERYEYDLMFRGAAPFRWRVTAGCYWGVKSVAGRGSWTQRIP